MTRSFFVLGLAGATLLAWRGLVNRRQRRAQRSEEAVCFGGDGHDIQDNEQRIREAAYFKWEQAGRPEGDGSVFWSEAERMALAAAATPGDESVPVE